MSCRLISFSFSPEILDFESIDSRLRKSRHLLPECFQIFAYVVTLAFAVDTFYKYRNYKQRTQQQQQATAGMAEAGDVTDAAKAAAPH